MSDNKIILTSENAPVVFANKPASYVSKRYAMVRTNDVVDALLEKGWHVHDFKMGKRNRRTLWNNPSAVSTAKHMLILRSENYPSIDGATPQICIVNAHDRTSAFCFYVGIFEMVCSNGLIAIRDGASFKIYHTNVTTADIVQASQITALQIPTFMKTRSILKEVEVTQQEAIEFAKRTIDMRWDGEKYKVDPQQLIEAKYNEQKDLTLWNVYNNVQRNMVNGGITVTNLDSVKRPTRKVSGIKQITKSVNINTALWREVENFAKEKGVALPVLNQNIKA